MPSPRYAAYQAADPYFNLVREALGDGVDGDHFFDVVSDRVVYEVLYDVPGWPRVIEGRTDLMAQFQGYGDNIELTSADNLITRRADDGAVILEYDGPGTTSDWREYDNRFCSIIEIEHRAVTHWRDYMDSLAAWNC